MYAPKGALLLHACNDLRALTLINHGRSGGAGKHGCHNCKVEATDRSTTGLNSTAYVDSVRWLERDSTMPLLVNVDPTLKLVTRADLQAHFQLVFESSGIGAYAEQERYGLNTHNEVVQAGRGYAAEMVNNPSTEPDPEKYPITGIPGLCGVWGFDIVDDNLSDPMHHIMNNCKDMFELMKDGVTKGNKEAEKVRIKFFRCLYSKLYSILYSNITLFNSFFDNLYSTLYPTIIVYSLYSHEFIYPLIYSFSYSLNYLYSIYTLYIYTLSILNKYAPNTGLETCVKAF